MKFTRFSHSTMKAVSSTCHARRFEKEVDFSHLEDKTPDSRMMKVIACAIEIAHRMGVLLSCRVRANLHCLLAWMFLCALWLLYNKPVRSGAHP